MIHQKFKDGVVEILGRWGLRRDAQPVSALKKQFKSFGEKSVLMGPVAWVLHPECISIGSHVTIHPYVRLVACTEYPEAGQKFNPEITIGDGCNIGWFVSIQAKCRVKIGRKVIFGSNISVTDLGHIYSDIERPIMDQGLTADTEVVIGDGCYIGNGAIILPNVHIGKNCVIGAGAVVTKDVPDFCVAAGNPAKIIRQYDSAAAEWVKKTGAFVL